MSFPGSQMIFAKGFTSETHPGGPQSFSDDDWLEAFYSRYSVWVLRVAENLLEGDPASGFQKDPDSGFAVLLILFPYFEMIARYHEGRKITPYRDGVKRGIELVFQGELLHILEPGESGYTVTEVGFEDSAEIKEKVLEKLCTDVRNELAHVAFTGKGVAISGGYPVPLAIRIDKNRNVVTVYLNPHRWARRIREHFEAYVDTLRNPEHTTERENFLRYAKRYVNRSS